MIMTMHDKLVYDNFTLCHICNEELVKDKVRDHCHLSGPKIQGAKSVSQLYFTICLAMRAIYLLKHWVIVKELFLAYQIMKKAIFLSRNRSSLSNKVGKEVNVKRELRFIDS